MIKSSTVIKRLVRDCWKPAAIISGVITLLLVISIVAGKLLGVSADKIYWTMVFIWFIGAGAKWAYDAKKSQIEYEQKEMLRDIEKKHL